MLRSTLLLLAALAIAARPAYAKPNSIKRRLADLEQRVRALEGRSVTGPPGPQGPKGDAGEQGPPGVPAPGLVVRDTNGALVGAVIGPTFAPVSPPVAPVSYPSSPDFGGDTPVARRIGDTVVEFSVASTGIVSGLNLVPDTLAFDSTDCSGAPHVIVDRHALMSMAWDENDVMYYAALPGVQGAFHSIAFFITDGSPCNFVTLPGGRCCRGNITNSPVKNLANVVRFDVTSLGLVPPFHIEGP